MSPIDLSIVIVSYNVRELLKQCLQSITANQNCTLKLETIVVDNASHDTSAALVSERFPTVHLIINAENRGFAAANNQGFRKSTGRHVMMLNPDTVVGGWALQAMVEFMDTHPHAGVCGGKLLYPDGTLQHSAFRFPTLGQIFFDFFPINWRLTDSWLNGRYSRARYARGEPFRIDHPLGADFLVRRQAAEQVGWLDERFFLYCEEIDWAIRFKRAGWQIWCVPQAEIVHHEAQSTQQFREQSFINLWSGRFQLFDKHYSRAFRFVARQIVRIGLWNLRKRDQAKARLKLVTQDELTQRLVAYRRVGELASSHGNPK